jgi:hypothetical protein
MQAQQVKPIRRVMYRQLAGDYEKILREMTWMCHEKGLEKAIKELQGKYPTYYITRADLTTEEDENDVNLVRIIDFSEIRSNPEALNKKTVDIRVISAVFYGCDTDYEYEIDAEINAKWLRSWGRDFKTFESYIAELISEYLTAVA